MTTNIVRLNQTDIEQPSQGPDPAEGAIEGSPIERTHEYYGEGGTSCGVWEGTPGRLIDDPHDLDEFVTLLEGRLGIIDNQTQEEEQFNAGDSFFLPRGSRLTWVIYETICKFYMTVD